MQNQNNTNPMETGSIPKLLAQLAIPAVVAQVVNLLYNIVDRIYIGHIPGIGAAALTGVRLFAPILMLLNAFAMLVGSGGALRIYMAGIFSTGFQISCQQSFMALGQAKVSLLLACLRKIILLIPLIFILPHFLPDKVFAVFLAEPVSDILAAAATTVTFLTLFNSILKKETK